MGTIKEVADRAKVSVGTVSNVLSGTAVVSPELRARVERAVRELNYHPNHIASSLKSRRTKTFGVVVSDITNPFFPRLVGDNTKPHKATGWAPQIPLADSLAAILERWRTEPD